MDKIRLKIIRTHLMNNREGSHSRNSLLTRAAHHVKTLSPSQYEHVQHICG